MSRTGRGVVEHETASKIRSGIANMSEGVMNAVSKVRELNEEQAEETADRSIPDGLVDLVLFGKLSEKITFGKYVFEITTLSNKQQREILKRMIPLSNEDKFLNLKIFTLTEAIASVNGQPLEQLYFGDNKDLSSFEKRIEFISVLQSSIVDKVFEKYEQLLKKSNELFEDGGLEESLKN
jgi:hypothetical protein